MSRKIIIYSVLLCVISVLIGWYGKTYTTQPKVRFKEIRENLSTYHYINPLLYINTFTQDPAFNSLRNLITNSIKTSTGNDDADSISVYFRDMNSGHWTGVDEDHQYEPSSMLKVLVMISYLKKAELDPSILNKQLYYRSTNTGQHYPPVHPLKAGYYSVTDLIRSMIVESDNDAVHLLDEGNDTAFYSIYNTLQLPPIPTADEAAIDVPDYMSPKSYSALFRTLYNATFLSRPDSEEALKLLSQTTFNKGLVAGIPEGITVAHKFGEHAVQTQTGEVIQSELHDCGIIYTQNHPYFLCVMTKGKDFAKLEKVISTISKIVYNYVATSSQ